MEKLAGDRRIKGYEKNFDWHGKLGPDGIIILWKSQIAYFVDNVPVLGEELSGIPVVSMSELLHENISMYEVVVCTGNYWEVAEQLENIGAEYIIFPPICETWPSVSQNISHDKWVPFLVELFDKPDVEILEIGSRRVTSGNVRSAFKKAN